MADPGNRKKATPKSDSSAADSSSCFLEVEPSKTFTDSTIRASTSRDGTRQSFGKRKVSIRKLSVEPTLEDIPLNDDCHELIEEKEKSIAEQEKLMNKSSNRTEEEPDISVVKTMTKEEMQEHVSRCLQLCTENKINTKNAFALKLIDCMTIITKNDEKSNFAAMACQLDAGAKIYSSRVDAVHQQVMKLVETCMFAEKKKKEKGTEEDGSEDDDDEGESGKGKEKKRKPRKKVLATHDQISRQPKETDPKDMFVRLEALPGDILNKAKYSPNDLSLTLEKHTPFWVDWQHYTPTQPQGEILIPDIDIKNHKLRTRGDLDLDYEIDLSTIPKLEALQLNSPQENVEDEDPAIMSQDSSQECADVFDGDDEDDGADEAEDASDLEMLTVAKLRMASEGSKLPSTQEVIKTLFHKPGESEYHYLKMDSSNFWAGPSYWKRPQGYNLAENKKKTLRRKKEPIEVLYTETEAKKAKEPGVGHAGKRASTLSKKTMSKWSKKKVTYPTDIHFEPETFSMLFNANIIAEVVRENPAEESKENPIDDKRAQNSDDDMLADSGKCSPDTFDQEDEFKGFPSPGSSQQEFEGFPSPSGSSEFDLEHGFRGFNLGDNQNIETSNPSTTDTDGEDPPSGSCDVYEGENLVPMPKMVKVDPIRIVAKPNRVDMQHLKRVMLNIIRRAIEDRENQMRGKGLSGSRGSVYFREVLSQVISSEQLHHRTREDLSVQMAFLCLLTLTNENNFHLSKDETEDVKIMYDPRDDPVV